MQRGSVIFTGRKHGPDVWQFRWSEKAGAVTGSTTSELSGQFNNTRMRNRCAESQ
jgi:hypothetical protein